MKSLLSLHSSNQGHRLWPILILLAVALFGCSDSSDPTDTDDPAAEILSAPTAWSGVWQTTLTPLNRAYDPVEQEVVIDQFCPDESVLTVFGLTPVDLGLPEDTPFTDINCDGVWDDTHADLTCSATLTDGDCIIVQTLTVNLILTDGESITGTFTLDVDATVACQILSSVDSYSVVGELLDGDLVGCSETDQHYNRGVPAAMGGHYLLTESLVDCNSGIPTSVELPVEIQICPEMPVDSIFLDGEMADNFTGGFDTDLTASAFWAETVEVDGCTVVTTYIMQLVVIGTGFTTDLAITERILEGNGCTTNETTVCYRYSGVRIDSDTTGCANGNDDDDPQHEYIPGGVNLPVNWGGVWNVDRQLTDCETQNIIESGIINQTWCVGSPLEFTFLDLDEPFDFNYNWSVQTAMATETSLILVAIGTRGAQTCLETISITLNAFITGANEATGSGTVAYISAEDCADSLWCRSFQFTAHRLSTDQGGCQ